MLFVNGLPLAVMELKNEKGTLCWEFAKRVGFQYGNGNPARLALIEAAGILTIETFCKVFSQVEA